MNPYGIPWRTLELQGSSMVWRKSFLLLDSNFLDQNWPWRKHLLDKMLSFSDQKPRQSLCAQTDTCWTYDRVSADHVLSSSGSVKASIRFGRSFSRTSRWHADWSWCFAFFGFHSYSDTKGKSLDGSTIPCCFGRIDRIFDWLRSSFASTMAHISSSGMPDYCWALVATSVISLMII
jgi:hypothetical protein